MLKAVHFYLKGVWSQLHAGDYLCRLNKPRAKMYLLGVSIVCVSLSIIQQSARIRQ